MVSTDRLEFPRSTPEHQGVDSLALLQFVEALNSQIHEVHSMMLLRHGAVIGEGWWSPYRPEHPHLLFSLSKSFTSTAVGLAVAEGALSLDDLVLPFFAEDAPVETSEFLSAMRVRHLLSMSTGHAVDTWSYMLDRPDGDWIKGFLSVPVIHEPGTHFLYNTGATYMLSAIVQTVTGMTVLDYLQPRLFEPLGIEGATWHNSPQGITAGGIGLSLRTEDVARFGQLYLQNGRWHDKQILSDAWVKAATTSQVPQSQGMQIDWKQGYGYQFWRSRHGAYRGDGVFGQYCVVMPEQDAVLVLTGGIDIFEMQQPLTLLWDILLPAMHAEALADNETAHRALTDTLSHLNLSPVQGKAASPRMAQVSGRIYAADANDLGIEAITFTFAETECQISVKTRAGDEAFPCGYGAWRPGRTTIFDEQLVCENARITSSGAWTEDETFTMVIRLYETPFFHTFECHFVGDDLLIETRVNVSLESLKPLLLTAQAV